MLIDAAFAALPILAILGLMLGLRWPAAQAGAVGLFIALVLAWSVFGLGTLVYGEIGLPLATAGVLLEALFVALTILWIIVPALLIYQLQVRTGAIAVLRQALSQLSDDPRIIVILVGWFFALFIEGAAGFGTTIALAAPFLVGVGFSPVAAVTIVLIGHSVGVSFGAVGTPIVPQIEATGASGLAIAQSTAIYHAALGWMMLCFALLVATRARALPIRSTIWGWAFLAAILFVVPYVLIAYLIGPELPTLGGALIGGIGFVALLRLARRRPVAAQVQITQMSIGRAAAPYLALIALVLITRLVPPVQQALIDVTIAWSLFDLFSGTFMPLYQAGTLLLVAFAIGALVQRAAAVDVRAALQETARRMVVVTIALVAMLGLARTMVHAEMIDTLAFAAADLAGGSWPLFAPFIGVLGTFVTGSATSSNILFTDLQQATAENLGLPVLAIIGAQGFGAAVGNIICPHNIIAGGATVGLSGEEGHVLRGTLPACLIYATCGGLIALLLVT